MSEKEVRPETRGDRDALLVLAVLDLEAALRKIRQVLEIREAIGDDAG